MLMFHAGMNVPLHDEGLRKSVGRGALGAGVVAVPAVGAGLLVSMLGATGHPAIYAVLIAYMHQSLVSLLVVRCVVLRLERRHRGWWRGRLDADAGVDDHRTVRSGDHGVAVELGDLGMGLDHRSDA